MVQTKLFYANYGLIQKYMDKEQRAYVRKYVADLKGDLFPVASHFLHNDGPNVRVRFTINAEGRDITVDIPLDIFNRLPVFHSAEDSSKPVFALYKQENAATQGEPNA
jgi:hypothetical protein